MSNIQNFTNDKFRVLAHLYDLRGQDDCARTTQQEVADELGLSRVTVSGIFKQLKGEEYLKSDTGHIGRYQLTNKALFAIEIFRSSDG